MINPELDRTKKINIELVDVKKEFTLLVEEVTENNWERSTKEEVWTSKEEKACIVQRELYCEERLTFKMRKALNGQKQLLRLWKNRTVSAWFATK